MMTVVRLFETADQARQAVAKINEPRPYLEAQFRDDAAYMLSPQEGVDAGSAVQAAIDAGWIPSSHVNVCTQGLQQGRTVVAVRPPFGGALVAGQIMDECGALDIPMPRYIPRDPTPFSDMLGWKTLSSGFTFNMKMLSRHDYCMFGNGLSRNQGPSFPTGLSKFKSTFGIGLLSNSAAPLSSMFGMKTLTKSDSASTDFWFPRLSKDPAPFSSFFGLPTLTKDQ